MTPEQLKASILQRAMEGKLVPQDLNDEPASELLKRIKAEKEKLIKEGKIKRDKNETEIFRGDDGLHYEKFHDGSVKQIDVPFEIPESWEWVNLGQVGTLQRGVGIKKSETVSKGIQCVRYGEIYTTYDYFFTETVSSTTSDVAKRSLAVNVNDILITLTGENKKDIGKAVAYLGNASCVMGGDLSKLSNHKMNAKYLSFILNSPNVKTQKSGLATGNIIVHISNSKLEKILVPIPPIKEQQEIVGKVEYYFKFVDEYEIAQNKLKKIIDDFPEKLRKSILQYAMQGKLVTQDATDEPVEVLLEKIREEKQKLFTEGKLKKKDLQESIIYQGDDNSYYENCPNTWAKVSLATISKITSGGTPKTDLKEYYNGEIPWFTPADLSKAQSNYYLDNSLKSITRLGLKNSSAQLIDAYSIVYSSRAPIGYINIVPKQYTTNQGCKSLTPYLVIVKWLYFAMRYATADIKKNASGTTFLEISASKLGDIYIDLPPISEQERIVDKIEKLWNKIDTLPFTP